MPKYVGVSVIGSDSGFFDVELCIDYYVFGVWHASIDPRAERKVIKADGYCRHIRSGAWIRTSVKLVAERLKNGSVRRLFTLDDQLGVYKVRTQKTIKPDRVVFLNRTLVRFHLTCNDKFGRKKWYRRWYIQAKDSIPRIWKYL